jgi:hypothetical protein
MVLAKHVLGFFRLLLEQLPEWYEAAGAESYLIASAVFIGHAEDRPMTASDIAAYTGLPRTTVIRKANLLMIAGLLERNGSRYCFTRPTLAKTHQVRPLVELVLKSARDLSRTDKNST